MRVLLAEDEPDLGTAIHRVLSREKYVVDWVQDGSKAWAYLDNFNVHYTLAILDWMLPGLSGVELCQRLRTQNNPLPVLMLTARDRMEDKIAGLDAGADDYLVKPFGMAELLARMRALQRRSPDLHPKQLQAGKLTLDYNGYTVCSQELNGQQVAIPLTTKEFQTLEYFMKHSSRIVTSEQLMNQLWEVGAEPTSNVVAAQIRLLRRKLAEVGCDGFIETVHGIGYRFNMPYASE
ncbi:response regulator transcription factor [Phormidium sp. CLA17]|uniref:two-component system response regulator RppA n=1 Tax=Leptolyngbya sp. Cla-17 TaxID=2803751 RepID=UPI001490CC8B|nr:two-component system response regulator RppA [Leptolyngbya sp. Cla-17]MBM0742163.1 response regulator transcription factor [Leptolyngbya sp. Cla-17]